MDELSRIREETDLRSRLLDEFTAEALEHLDIAESMLLEAEKGSVSAEGRSQVLRAMHSIKGAASYLGLDAIREIAHALETAAQRLEVGAASKNEASLALLLEGTTELRRLLEHAGEPLEVPSALLRALESTGGADGAAASATAQPNRPSVDDIFVDVASQQCQAIRVAADRLASDPQDVAGRDMLRRAVGSLKSAAEYAGREDVLAILGAKAGRLDDVDSGGASDLATLLEEALARKPAELRPEAAQTDEDGRQVGELTATAGELSAGRGRTFRVAQERMDQLVDQVAELVTVRNQVQHFLASLDANGCNAVLCRQAKALAFSLTRAVDDLQAVAMELRLVRLETVFRPLHRVARDVAARTDKQVRLEVVGGDTEIDKGVAEAIADPLVHLVRNAVDHGIEAAAQRMACGKPAAGLVRVVARREGNSVVITVSDDGSGVDLDAVRAKAVARGLLDEAVAATLSERGVYDLLFQSGFSTASTVTEVSGRGVGLDVVKTNVNRLGGAVSISSTLGKGTQIEVRLPVRLAAQDVLLVKVGAETFAVPSDSIRESICVSDKQIRRVAGRPTTVNRGRLVPLLPLAETIGLEENGASRGSTLEVVVVELGTQQVGFIVDEIGQHYQVVVKPLDSFVSVPGVNGATVLADGRVVLVIDPARLVGTASS